MILPRTEDVEYDVAHWHDIFVFVKRTPETPNSEIVVALRSSPTVQRTILPHSSDFKIEDIALSERFTAVFGRIGGLQQGSVYELPTTYDADAIRMDAGRKLEFDEPAYEMGLTSQGEFDSEVVAISYTSLTTPPTTFWQNMATGVRVIKKVHPVLGGFVKGDYVTERISATSPDGVKVLLVTQFTSAPVSKLIYFVFCETLI